MTHHIICPPRHPENQPTIQEIIARARAQPSIEDSKTDVKPEAPESPEVQEPINSEPPTNIDGFIYVPNINLYLSEETHFKNQNWTEAHILTQEKGYKMPTINQFVEFLKYLRTTEGKAKVKNAEAILKEIYEVRSPWRSEWLDAKFVKKDKNMLIHYNHFYNGTVLVPQKKEILTDYLSENKTPGISLDNWLANPNPHGLPKSNCQDGRMYYWQPTNGAVVGFSAGSDVANLNCSRVPDYHDDSLGVRLVVSSGDNK